MPPFPQPLTLPPLERRTRIRHFGHIRRVSLSSRRTRESSFESNSRPTVSLPVFHTAIWSAPNSCVDHHRKPSKQVLRSKMTRLRWANGTLVMPNGNNAPRITNTVTIGDDISRRPPSELPSALTRPTHISLDGVASFNSMTVSPMPSASPSGWQDPYDPLLSPELTFYTAPSTPTWDDASEYATPGSESNMDLFAASVFNRQNSSSAAVPAVYHRCEAPHYNTSPLYRLLTTCF